MALTALDTYGRTLVRAILSEDPSPAYLDSIRVMLHAGQASFTVEDVAAEIGVTLPVPAPLPGTDPRRVPRRKVRA